MIEQAGVIATALAVAAAWCWCALFLVRKAGLSVPDPCVHPSHPDYVGLYAFDCLAGVVLGAFSPLLLAAVLLAFVVDDARSMWSRR